MPGQRRDYGRRVLAGHFDQYGETRMVPPGLRCDCSLCRLSRSPLPMTGDSTIFNLCTEPFPDRDGIDDLTSGLSVSLRVQ